MKAKRCNRVWWMAAAVMLAVMIYGTAAAEPDEAHPLDLVDNLGQTLEKSLKAEEENLSVYQERLARTERERVYMTAAANAYQLQLSTFGNLLLSSGVDISVLQKTRSQIKSSQVEIQKMIDETAPGSDTLVLEQQNLDQQKQLVEKQIAELSRINAAAPRNPATQTLEKTARGLAVVLKGKKNLVTKLNQIYQTHLESLLKTKEAFSGLAGQFDTLIEQRKAKDLFERKKEVFRFAALASLMDEGRVLLGRAGLAVQPEFWVKGVQRLWQSAELVAVSFVLVLWAALALLVRLRQTMAGLQNHALVQRLGNWHGLAVRLASQAVIPLGLAMTLLFYSVLDTMYLIASALHAAGFLLLAVLVVRWADTAFSGGVADALGGKMVARPLTKLCRGAALFSMAYLPVSFVLGQDAGLLVVFRVIGALLMLVWGLVTFRNRDKGRAVEDENGQGPVGLKIRAIIKSLVMGIAGVALVMDMTGYGSLSVHWLLSWARSLLILAWWALFFGMIREWDRHYREKSRMKRNEFLYDDYPVQWLIIRAGQFLWLISLLAALLLAWGNQQTVLGKLYGFLAHPLVVGNMKFSVMGMVYAGAILMATYALTRIWKWVFQTKFLSRSGMAPGLQDSITTITAYVIWIFGILVSLHAFGLNTASLAVAFGALGIGLGFGLQNVFNNFISGIILLFERPIQVGDDVEINGIWAQVKKINVRSTLVQTYDNASLIIPNADFISSQVTNWSFKDKRIRRNINVGVAYGSNVDLVKDTLMEIAGATPKVLKYPRPDVLFRDFGDSALVFRLRVWTDIDNMLTVETDIRFRIDRLFRERQIEISFPQRDIHIRSMVDKAGGEKDALFPGDNPI